MESSGDFANAFQALSVILVFVTVLFGVKYPQFCADIDSKMPDPRLGKELHSYIQRLKINFISNLIPIMIVNVTCSYLVMPTVYKIVITSSFNLIDFDFLKTAFVMVAGLIYLFTIYTFYIGYQYVNMIRRGTKSKSET